MDHVPVGGLTGPRHPPQLRAWLVHGTRAAWLWAEGHRIGVAGPRPGAWFVSCVTDVAPSS